MVAQLFHTKDVLLPNNSGNHMTSRNLIRQCTVNLNAKIGIVLTQFLLFLNVIFTLSSKINFTSNNSKPSCCTCIVRVEVPFKGPLVTQK